MTLLAEKSLEGIDLNRILVEVYPQNAEETSTSKENHATEIFVEINKAEPIKLIDMPGIVRKADRHIITDGATRVQARFQDMFSVNQRCRAPHLNIDNLRDALFAADVIGRHQLKSPAAMEEWMMKQNELLAEKYHKNVDDVQDKVPKSALTKAKKYDFYLGLESSWFYN